MDLLKRNFDKLIFLIIFSALFFAGIFTYQDYGISVDEKFQRLNGFYWLNYLVNFTNSEDLKTLVLIKLSSIQDFTLADIQKFNFYGVLFDLPAALLETIFNINNSSDIYNLRHLLNFFYYFVGSIFFYKILKKRFNNSVSLFGILLFLISPRIYGESFYNSKDIIFLSFLCIAIFYCFEFLENKKTRNLILFSFFSAACIQTRIIGIFLPLSFFVFYFFSLVSNNKEIYFAPKYILYILLTLFFLFISWPYLWENPIKNFLYIFTNLSSITPDIKIFFNGKYVDVNYMPFNYLPTWIVISSPVINSFLFLIGSYFMFVRLFKRFISFEKLKLNKFDLWRSKKELQDLFILINFYTIIIIFISFNITLVNSWRYAFFLNIFKIYIATFALNYLFIKLKNKKLNLSLKSFVVFFLLINLYKIYYFHPFQGLYFNSFLTSKYKNSFEIDHSAVSGRDALIWIIKNADIRKDDKINIAVASWSPLYRNVEALEEKNKKLINIVGQNYSDADFIYTNNISEVDKTKDKKYDIPNKFNQVYKLLLDNIIVYEVYKRK